MCRQTNKIRGNKNGFTLIEVCVALTIFIFIGLGLTQAFPFGSIIVRDSKNQTIATYVSQSKIEELISQDYFNIATGIIETKQAVASSTSPLSIFKRETKVYYLSSDFSATSTDPADDEGLKVVNVSVYYPGRDSQVEKEYQVNFIISQR